MEELCTQDWEGGNPQPGETEVLRDTEVVKNHERCGGDASGSIPCCLFQYKSSIKRCWQMEGSDETTQRLVTLSSSLLRHAVDARS